VLSNVIGLYSWSVTYSVTRNRYIKYLPERLKHENRSSRHYNLFIQPGSRFEHTLNDSIIIECWVNLDYNARSVCIIFYLLLRADILWACSLYRRLNRRAWNLCGDKLRSGYKLIVFITLVEPLWKYRKICKREIWLCTLLFVSPVIFCIMSSQLCKWACSQHRRNVLMYTCVSAGTK
jgi:hypothetical protein